uniref:Uncharacterized protein n=1 Tax=Arundo donax TaxID=35708 RepID=A0A0A8Z0M1_ARUDO
MSMAPTGISRKSESF